MHSAWLGLLHNLPAWSRHRCQVEADHSFHAVCSLSSNATRELGWPKPLPQRPTLFASATWRGRRSQVHQRLHTGRLQEPHGMQAGSCLASLHLQSPLHHQHQPVPAHHRLCPAVLADCSLTRCGWQCLGP